MARKYIVCVDGRDYTFSARVEAERYARRQAVAHNTTMDVWRIEGPEGLEVESRVYACDRNARKLVP